MYLVFAIVAGMSAFLPSLMMRTELVAPGMPIFSDPRATQLFVFGAGLIMALFMFIPALIGGFGGWFVPRMIGAPGMAFPRLHRITFWLMPASFALFLLSLLVESGSASAAFGSHWTALCSARLAMNIALVSLYIAGASSILNAINFITTIVNMRAPDMTLREMPLFVWSILATAILLLVWLPVFTSAVTLRSPDWYLGLNYVSPGGDRETFPFRHEMWFLFHPELYALILPSLGIISQIVSTFSKRAVFGHLAMAYAMVAFGYIGSVVWTHFLYSGRPSTETKFYFGLVISAIAISLGTSVIAWIVTMWRGTVSFRAPMLWTIGFVCLFSLEGVTGAVHAAAGVDASPNDTYYVAARFQNELTLDTVFVVFASWYYWFPKVSGFLYNETLAKLHFWLTFIGVNLVFFPQHFLDLAGVLGQYVDYRHADARWNQLITIGSYATIAGLVMFALCMVEAFVRRQAASQNPWKATTLEWTTS